MKKIIHISFITAFIFILSGCNKRKVNQNLIGSWSSTSMEMEMSFYQDSLVYQFGQPIKFSWYSDNEKIYLEQKTRIDKKLPTNFVEVYKLNDSQDTLTLRHDGDRDEHMFVRKQYK